MKLLIAEKPSVAQEIAAVVGADKRRTGYLEGNGWIVSWCYGHLVDLADPPTYNPELSQWSLETLPILPEQFQTVIGEKTKDQFERVKELMARADVTELVEATDAGREGELIFRLVYDKAGCKKPFFRLWLSSMERSAIRKALEEMKPGKDYDLLYEAARCRQQADWLVGMNLTRLYSKVYDSRLPVGRVQTPTVALVVQRGREIENFQPEKYFVVTADFGGFSGTTRVPTQRQAAELMERCRGADGYVTRVTEKKIAKKPPALMDLTALQREANRLCGYTALETLDTLQQLYEAKLVTYPRTDSRYIPEDMRQSAEGLLTGLAGLGLLPSDHQNDVGKVINNDEVRDHHALLPTKEVTPERMAKLTGKQRDILRLVISSLGRATAEDYEYTSMEALFDVEGEAFKASGQLLLQSGWREYDEDLRQRLGRNEDKDKDEAVGENLLPRLHEGEVYPVQTMRTAEKQTQPPKAYTEDTLLAAMESAVRRVSDGGEIPDTAGLGTPATRAGIIESVIRSGYLRRDGKKILPNEMGKTLVSVVTEELRQPELTAGWERSLSAIQAGTLEPEEFMGEIRRFVRSHVETVKLFHDPEEVKDVFQRPGARWTEVGICPCCGKTVREYPKSYACEAVQSGGCGFVVWKKIAGKEITPTQVKKLINNGVTDTIKGFISTRTGKKFDARLVLDDKKQPKFDFPRAKHR